MTLDFLVNYNSSLLNFIDCVSCWDEFVDEGMLKYFEENFIVGSNCRECLSEYVKYRRPLGWENETNLLDWAYLGYSNNAEFNNLLPSIECLSKVRNMDGLTLGEYLKQFDNKLLRVRELLKAEYVKLDLSLFLTKMDDLFGVNKFDKTIPCYLTISPIKTIIGGANGFGIYTQIAVNSSDEKIRENTFNTIIHELFHKLLNLNQFFNSLGVESQNDLIDFESGEVLPGTVDNFIEEVIIHSLNDVILFKDDPVQRLAVYEERSIVDKQAVYYKLLWKYVVPSSKIIQDFLGNTLNKERTLELLRQEYFSLFEK